MEMKPISEIKPGDIVSGWFVSSVINGKQFAGFSSDPGTPDKVRAWSAKHNIKATITYVEGFEV